MTGFPQDPQRPALSDEAGPPIVPVAIGVLVRPPVATGGEPRVLIARRPDDTVYGGYWELPGGKLDGDETPDQCLIREFLEELGLEVEPTRPLPTIEHVYPHGHVRLHPFYCRHVAGEVRHLQVADHRWVRPDALGDYTFPEANEPLIARIRRDLAPPAPPTPR